MIPQSADVVIIGSGPTGSAYARIIRRDWPEARILMVEAGPATSERPGTHLVNLGDAQTTAELSAQGPDRTPYAPITEAEWEARKSGDFDASLLRRQGLFVSNTDPKDETVFAGFAAAAVGGMGTQWTAGCPWPAEIERPDCIAPEAMVEALKLSDDLLGADPDPFPEDTDSAAMRARLAAVFDEGRPEDRRVQPMPLAITRTDEGIRRHGTDVILGDMVDEPASLFQILPDTACLRVLHEDGRATGVVLGQAGGEGTTTVAAGSVVVAADSLHGPQLLHASGIRPAALGRSINDHFQVTRLIQVEAQGPLTSMSWIPRTDADFPFSVTIGGAGPHQLPYPVAIEGTPVLIGIFVASDLVEDSRMVFDEDTPDWKGLPSFSIMATPTEADRARIDAGRALVDKITGVLGRPIPGIEIAELPIGSALHYQGTLRMGASDDGTSVCDPESRVWGFENLHVAGNGVIPTVTATNPTPYCVALATIGAQAIARARRTA